MLLTYQNELIAALYHNMIEELKKELLTATCFSRMIDEASDSGCNEQASVVRYMDIAFVINVNIEQTDSTDADCFKFY